LAFDAGASAPTSETNRTGTDESLLFDHLTGGEFIEFAGRIYAWSA